MQLCHASPTGPNGHFLLESLRPKSLNPNENGPQIVLKYHRQCFQPREVQNKELFATGSHLLSQFHFCMNQPHPHKPCLGLICHLHEHTHTHTHIFAHTAQALGFISTDLLQWSTEQILTDLISLFSWCALDTSAFYIFFPF